MCPGSPYGPQGTFSDYHWSPYYNSRLVLVGSGGINESMAGLYSCVERNLDDTEARGSRH